MQSLRIVLLCTTLVVVALAQQISKPQISNITMAPSDPISTSGTCTASWAGYVEHKGKKITEAEIGKFVASRLRDGYILTVYPETANGVFADMKCVATPKASAPERP
jgi:hypothetical protein